MCSHGAPGNAFLMNVPREFLLGVATSAWQIEGAQGRSRSIWDEFLGLGPDFRAAQFRLEDLDLLRELGVDAYRFSLSWPRVLAGGLDFYVRLLERLRSLGIQSWVTLYHWELPEGLCWTRSSTVEAFREFVRSVAGLPVDAWCTLNEPWCSGVLGYLTGEHAPGLQLPDISAVRSSLREAHRAALAELRAMGQRAGLVAVPLVARGEGSREWFAAQNDPWLADLDVGDFLGVNVYYPTFLEGLPPGTPVNSMGWPVVPGVMTEVLEQVYERYRPPALYVTETGWAGGAGLRDPQRIHFVRQMLREALEARSRGIPVEGLFVWTLFDNYEWGYGESVRFGLYETDYATGARRARKSARWWSRMARERRF